MNTWTRQYEGCTAEMRAFTRAYTSRKPWTIRKFLHVLFSRASAAIAELACNNVQTGSMFTRKEAHGFARTLRAAAMSGRRPHVYLRELCCCRRPGRLRSRKCCRARSGSNTLALPPRGSDLLQSRCGLWLLAQATIRVAVGAGGHRSSAEEAPATLRQQVHVSRHVHSIRTDNFWAGRLSGRTTHRFSRRGNATCTRVHLRPVQGFVQMATT